MGGGTLGRACGWDDDDDGAAAAEDDCGPGVVSSETTPCFPGTPTSEPALTDEILSEPSCFPPPVD